MGAIKTRDIRRALLKKGFRQDNSRHQRFYLYVDDQKTPVWTVMSHGHDEIDNSLIAQMRQQMYLGKPEFLAFVDCDLSSTDYLDRLREQQVISLPDW